ncbi:hypothetical protein CCHR01_06695 [Colletotrichum chrysophilum]|uniref:Uncharacterized protein n=1 Tax=Colletotrichum chrysophilum TaxID=1836956 RepID=A0AAD9EJI1_9PEZI|nr:hypothetical protein CCHR01_06695 [Colletotrichum chrysophilum]
MKKCRVSAGSPSPWHAESRMCGAVLGSKRRVASQLAGGGRSGTGFNRGGFAFWARCLGFCQPFCHGILGLMAPACCSPRRHPRNLGAGRRGERDGHRLRYTSTKSSLSCALRVSPRESGPGPWLPSQFFLSLPPFRLTLESWLGGVRAAGQLSLFL